MGAFNVFEFLISDIISDRSQYVKNQMRVAFKRVVEDRFPILS